MTDEPDNMDSDRSRQVTEWLKKLTGTWGNSILDEFETVKLAREMADRWPREYQKLLARIERIRKRINELKELAQPRRKDVLDNVHQYANLVTEIKKFNAELGQLQAEIRRLASQPGRDKAALLEARKRDEQRIRELAQIATFNKQAIQQLVRTSVSCDRRAA